MFSVNTTKKPRAKRKPAMRIEAQHQKGVILWFNSSYPMHSKMLVAIPNEGKRKISGHAEAKRMGLKKGFPDLFLFVPRGTYPGLAIEMKKPAKTEAEKLRLVGEEQEEYNKLLLSYGYAAVICYTMREAVDVIMRYMDETLVI